MTVRQSTLNSSFVQGWKWVFSGRESVSGVTKPTCGLLIRFLSACLYRLIARF